MQIETIIHIIGWPLIITASLAARHQIQRIYGLPTDIERVRSIRYRRAVRRSTIHRRYAPRR